MVLKCTKRLVFCISILFLSFVNSPGQTRTELEESILTLEGIDKIDYKNKLTFLIAESNPEEAKSYAIDAISLARKAKYFKGVATAYHNYAIIMRWQGYYDSALAYEDTALQHFDTLEYQSLAASVSGNRAVAFQNKGDYKKALRLFIKAAQIHRNMDHSSKEATVLNSLGVMYMNMENYTKANEYYRKALRIQTGEGNRKEVANSLNNLAIVQANTGDLDSAIYYFNESYDIEKSLENKKGMSECVNNIGAVYYYKGQLDVAIDHFMRSYAIDSALGDIRGMIATKSNIAEIYLESNQVEKGINLLKLSYKQAREIDSKEDIEAAAINLSNAYEKEKEFELALFWSNRYQKLHDALLNQNRQRALTEMETKYQSREKERRLKIKNLKIQDQQLQLKARQILIISLLIGLILLLAIIFFLRKYLVAKKETGIEKARSEAKDAELKAVIHATEKERKRIARELHDGIGQQLSSVKLGIGQMLAEKSQGKAVDPERLKKVEQVIQESSQDVRNLSHQMMPKALSQVGLVPALQDMLINSCELSGLTFDFEEIGMDRRLDEMQEINLFRIGQEVVQNALKHAQATHISMEIIVVKKRLSLIITDNGQGFSERNRKGLGMLTIESRVGQMKGDFFIDSSKGTIFTLRIPLD